MAWLKPRTWVQRKGGGWDDLPGPSIADLNPALAEQRRTVLVGGRGPELMNQSIRAFGDAIGSAGITAEEAAEAMRGLTAASSAVTVEDAVDEMRARRMSAEEVRRAGYEPIEVTAFGDEIRTYVFGEQLSEHELGNGYTSGSTNDTVEGSVYAGFKRDLMEARTAEPEPGCKYCGSHYTRQNARGGHECSGCSAPVARIDVTGRWPEPAAGDRIPR